VNKLENKVALVTAAAGAGIGQATARAFAQEGARVVVSDAHEGRLARVAREMQDEFGQRILAVPCDVTSREQVEQMVRRTLEEFGRIDILVNNAGIDRPQPIWEMTDEAWELVINVNLRGTFYCCRAVIPTMMKQRSGRIINLSSVVAWAPSKEDGAAYVACKAGIQGLTRSLAVQLAEYNITVNAIAPGLIFNPFLARVRPSEYFDKIREKIPLGRDGTPQDVAHVILFLSSDEAAYITGECLCISGGWFMH